MPEPQCLFRHEGEYWTLAFAGATCRLKDTRGLHYLARLLRHPHYEFSAIDLASSSAGVKASSVTTPTVFHNPSLELVQVASCTAAGEVLDPQVRASYKQRLTDLQIELEEAESFNDLGRIEKMQTEIDFLTQEFSHVVGLGGRPRKVGSAVERARVNVTKILKTTLTRIDKAHPVLGRYLARTIRTGARCVYAPDLRQPIQWTVE